jgi:hypothetical protein
MKKISNKISFVLSSFVLCIFTSSLWASEEINTRQSERVLLALDNAFIPADGFDDNDNIQVVIEGYLPNACYTLAQAGAVLDDESHTLIVYQAAMKATRGVCADGAELPPDLAAPRYFWKVVDVGHLQAGHYKLEYRSSLGRQFKDFRVQFSPSEQVDNMDYVLVTNAFVNNEVLSSQEQFEIRITGELTSSCAVLDESSLVYEAGDVIVVLLTTKRTAEFCMPASRPFYRVIRARTPAKGRYLLHVRSVGGESRNKIFSVVDSL